MLCSCPEYDARKFCLFPFCNHVRKNDGFVRQILMRPCQKEDVVVSCHTCIGSVLIARDISSRVKAVIVNGLYLV